MIRKPEQRWAIYALHPKYGEFQIIRNRTYPEEDEAVAAAYIHLASTRRFLFLGDEEPTPIDVLYVRHPDGRSRPVRPLRERIAMNSKIVVRYGDDEEIPFPDTDSGFLEAVDYATEWKRNTPDQRPIPIVLVAETIIITV